MKTPHTNIEKVIRMGCFIIYNNVISVNVLQNQTRQ